MIHRWGCRRSHSWYIYATAEWLNRKFSIVIQGIDDVDAPFMEQIEASGRNCHGRNECDRLCLFWRKRRDPGCGWICHCILYRPHKKRSFLCSQQRWITPEMLCLCLGTGWATTGITLSGIRQGMMLDAIIESSKWYRRRKSDIIKFSLIGR